MIHRLPLVLCACLLAGCRSLPTQEPLVFAVLGDNRGGPDGAQPAAFRDLVAEVEALRPVFVWNAGDMIYGRTTDLDAVRKQWRTYRETIAPLSMPVFHLPGNHDLWDDASARIYRELWGASYFVHDHGLFRFIALDTETQPGRLGVDQWHWLRSRLHESTDRRVIVLLHRPLFPVGPHLGTSMDAFPEERDALHALLREYRANIAAVFASHEHLYHHELRDGIHYYITGGAGSELHAPPERGGFHHFLEVRATADALEVVMRKTGRHHRMVTPARPLAPGILEDWSQSRAWFAWDHTVEVERDTALALHGNASLRMDVDFTRCGWPVLYTPLDTAARTHAFDAWSLYVHVPEDAPPDLRVTASIEGSARHEAAPVALTPGWNLVRTEASAQPWPSAWRADLGFFQWVLRTEDPDWRGAVHFDRFAVDAPATREESWEAPLVWMLWDEDVRAERDPGQPDTLRILYDRISSPEPMLIGRAGPPRDLRAIGGVTLRVVAPDLPPRLSLLIRAGERDHIAPAVTLTPGAQFVHVPLDTAWLPSAARAEVQQIAWRIEPAPQDDRGWLVVGEMHATPLERNP